MLNDTHVGGETTRTTAARSETAAVRLVAKQGATDACEMMQKRGIFWITSTIFWPRMYFCSWWAHKRLWLRPRCKAAAVLEDPLVDPAAIQR